MTPAQILAAREAIAKATKGNWTSDEMTDGDQPNGDLWVQCERNDAVSGIFEHIGVNEHDAAFIALARQALPAAIEEIERLRSALSEFAEYDCEYGDGCPTFGTRHGRCVGCKARQGKR